MYINRLVGHTIQDNSHEVGPRPDNPQDIICNPKVIIRDNSGNEEEYSLDLGNLDDLGNYYFFKKNGEWWIHHEELRKIFEIKLNSEHSQNCEDYINRRDDFMDITEKTYGITDIGTWWNDEAKNKVFRYLTYKKVYTPYEQDKKFMDESMFEDDYHFGIISNIMEIPNDILIEFDDGYFDCETSNVFQFTGIKIYKKLSDISLEQFEKDNKDVIFKEKVEEDDDYEEEE